MDARKNNLRKDYTNRELAPYDEDFILPYYKLREIINYRNAFNHYLDTEKKKIDHEHQINRHDELLQEGLIAWNKFCGNFVNNEKMYIHSLIHKKFSTGLMY